MADNADCANALVNLLGAALYPSGLGAGSPIGVNFRIYRGHPGPAALDADMQAGFTETTSGWVLTSATSRIVHVCVNPRPGLTRIKVPYVFTPPQAQTIPAQTLTVTVSGNALTLSGTVSAGQGVAASYNGVAVGVTAGSTDTLTSLATELAAAFVAAGQTATASGPTVTV